MQSVSLHLPPRPLQCYEVSTGVQTLLFKSHVCVAVVMEVDEMERRMPELQESEERLTIKRETESDEERDDDGKHMIVLIE